MFLSRGQSTGQHPVRQYDVQDLDVSCFLPCKNSHGSHDVKQRKNIFDILRRIYTSKRNSLPRPEVNPRIDIATTLIWFKHRKNVAPLNLALQSEALRL